MRSCRLTVTLACAALLSLVGAELAGAQTPGPITAATAKAAGAQDYGRGFCMAECKARGRERKVERTSADCAKWCTLGQCYFSQRLEPYCIK